MTPDDIALTLYTEINSRTVTHLVECFGSATSVFNAPEEELVIRAELSPVVVKLLHGKIHHVEAEREVAYLSRNGYHAVAATDEEYPKLLQECQDRPHVLYVNGDPDMLNRSMLTMIGTRDATSYGQIMCDRLVGELADKLPDLVIVSGLAYGIDIACSRAALKYRLKTIAVMGTPLSKIYPSQHTAFARDIVNSGGAILSEMHSGQAVHKSSFVARNRILAGMSMGTVIVESPPSGGSLITCDLAEGYSRVVMSVPGRADAWSSAGTNSLIKRMKAQMVCSARDILFELGWEESAAESNLPPEPLELDMDPVHRRIMACFGSESVRTEYELGEECGLSYPDLCEAMFMLECAGLVKSVSGGKYEKL